MTSLSSSTADIIIRINVKYLAFFAFLLPPRSVSAAVSVAAPTNVAAVAPFPIVASLTHHKAAWLLRLEQTAAFHIAATSVRKVLSGENYVLVVVLALLVGGLGIHRYAMGSNLWVILGYALLNLPALFLPYLWLGILLGLIDFVLLLTDHDMSRYLDKNLLFAAFDGSNKLLR